MELPATLRAVLFIAILGASVCHAQPTLTVSNIGINGNSNREWLVQVSPDASLFTTGSGSIAAELAFEVTAGTLVSATKTGSLWPFDNPGNDPFTGSVSIGVNANTAAGTVFAALGSDLFTTDAPASIFTIETAGMGTTTLEWGGHTLLSGQANQYTGSRLAQAGMNFDNFAGTLTAMDTGGMLVCDADGDGDCDQTDINALYSAFGSAGQLDLDNSGTVDAPDIALWLAAASAPNNSSKLDPAHVFVIGDVNLDGQVDSTDLGQLLNNFSVGNMPTWSAGNLNGDTSINSSDLGLLLNNFGAASASVVPEPNTLSIVWVGLLGLLLARKRLS